MIKRKSVNNDDETQIATYCIVSTDYLEQFIPLYQAELFQIEYVKIVVKWAIDYYNSYKIAPKEIIQEIFKAKSDGELQETQANLIARFLEKLSDDFIKSNFSENIGYLITKAENYMRVRNMQHKLSKARNYVTEGNITEAETIFHTYNPLVRQISKGINPFKDKEFVKNIFKVDNGNNLLRIQGDIGKLVGQIKRKQFIAFAGPEKRGKSYWLMALMDKIILAGLSVAMFHFELSEDEYIERWLRSLTGRSATNTELLIPVFDCKLNQANTCCKRERINKVSISTDKDGNKPIYGHHNKEYKSCSICIRQKDYVYDTWWKFIKRAILTDKLAIQKLNAVNKQFVRGDKLRILSRPSDSFTISDLKAQLIQWEKTEKFIPDIVLTDYADLMLAEKGINDYRHRIDNIWKGHKKIAQEFNIAVISASQTTKGTLEKDVKKGDLSEDKRKASHTDRFLAINQTDEEKENGISRISVLFERHQFASTLRQCIVLQNIDIGRVNLDSFIPLYNKKPVIKDKSK